MTTVRLRTGPGDLRTDVAVRAVAAVGPAISSGEGEVWMFDVGLIGGALLRASYTSRESATDARDELARAMAHLDR